MIKDINRLDDKNNQNILFDGTLPSSLQHILVFSAGQNPTESRGKVTVVYGQKNDWMRDCRIAGLRPIVVVRVNKIELSRTALLVSSVAIRDSVIN